MGAWEEESIIKALVKHFGEGKDKAEKKELREEITDSLDLSKGRYAREGNAGSFTADGDEYNIIEDDDEAERIAIEYIKNTLESEPEVFNPGFLQSHIYVSDTDRRIISQEEADSVEGDMSDDDALEQVKMKDDYDELEEKIDALQNEKEDLESDLEDLREGLDDPDETEKDRISGEIEEAERRIAEINAELGESGDVDKAKEKMVEDAREKVREEIIDEWENGLKDPVSFLVEEHGMYSMEDLMKANFIVIDYDAAAQDAIDSDGWAHHLSMYDGDYNEIDGGYVIFRD